MSLSELKIGDEVIYFEQIKAGEEVIEEFAKHQGPPLLIAQTQQGKTGVAIFVAKMIKDEWEKQHIDYEILFILHISDNELKTQQQERLQNAGLYEPNASCKVKVFHLADFCKKKNGEYVLPEKINLYAQKRLIFLDECHQALGKNRPLNVLFEKLGINYGNPISEWNNRENYILSLSATPFASVIQSRIKENSFSCIQLELNGNYYSIEDAREDERFVFVGDTRVADLHKSCVTDFFKDKLVEFLASCEKYGNGHLVVRTIGVAPFIIERYLKREYPDIWFREYTTDGDYEIAQLDDALSKEPKKPSIVIIKGAMRAGKTLNETKYIRGHIDAYKTDDSLYQAVGRYLGFPCKSGHRKQDDVFPIYISNSQVVDNIIGFFDGDFTIIPGGRWNSQSRTRRQYKMDIIDKEDIKEGESISPISTNKAKDLAKMLLGEVAINIRRLVYCDAPNSKNIDSWNRLVKEHPDWVAKYVRFEIIEDAIEIGKLKKTVMYL